MSYFSRLTVASTAIGLAFAFPAAADISAQDLRDEIVSLYEGIGYHVTIGSESSSGGVISLENVALIFDVPENGGQITATYEWIKLNQIGGAVEVTLSPTLGIVGLIHDKGDKDVDITAHVAMNDAKLIVSGSMDDMHLDSTVSGGEMKVDKLVVGGKDIPLNARFGFGLATSSTKIQRGENGELHYSGDSEIASLDIAADMQKPGGGGFFTMTGRLADLVAGAEIEGTLSENPEEILDAGFFVDVSMETGATYFDVNFSDGDQRFAMTSEMEGNGFGMAVSNDGFAYEIDEKGVKLNLSSSELPIPAVTVSFDELSLAIDVPLSKTEEPADFTAKTALRNFSISEAVWSMFDPTKSIPRDPASAAIDISGKVMVLMDILSSENIDKLDNMDGPPMLPSSMTLNELLVSFGGAELKGNGSVTFDFSNPNTIQGVPAPTGSFDISLNGSFGLMDKLAGLGLILPDASFGLRAMIGAFAKPVGEDAFVSKVELGADGSIKANGQQLQ